MFSPLHNELSWLWSQVLIIYDQLYFTTAFCIACLVTSKHVSLFLHFGSPTHQLCLQAHYLARIAILPFYCLHSAQTQSWFVCDTFLFSMIQNEAMTTTAINQWMQATYQLRLNNLIYVLSSGALGHYC